MGCGMLNLGSIAFGLAGWILPILHASQLAKRGKGLGRYVHTLSMGACALALWLQICYDEHLVNIADWSALMDTAAAVRKVSIFLLATTFLINLIMARVESALDKEEEEDQDLTI